MLSLPPHTAVLETALFKLAFDESGILCVVAQMGESSSLQDAKQALMETRFFLGSRKVCILMDITHCITTPRTIWREAAGAFPRQIKAVALLSDNPLGKIMANLLFTLNAQPYPVYFLNDETAARRWLGKYL